MPMPKRSPRKPPRSSRAPVLSSVEESLDAVVGFDRSLGSRLQVVGAELPGLQSLPVLVLLDGDRLRLLQRGQRCGRRLLRADRLHRAVRIGGLALQRVALLRELR